MSNPSQTGHLFCFGLGYTATNLARQLIAAGWRVSGTCRDEARQGELRELGIEAHLFDRDRALADIDGLLTGVTHLLSSVPPDDRGDPVLDLHGDDLRGQQHLQWIGYLSTTGVYGDRKGGWVDESSELTPSGMRGAKRLAAERQWLQLSPPAHLFRLAGIYGPGSSAIETVQAGRAKRIHKPGQVFSRIHVDDIVQVLMASMTHPSPGSAYNVCDDDPASPADVIAYACELLGRQPPPVIPFAEAELSPMARSFYDDNKRVSNDRIKRELGITLLYPSYRQGLEAIHNGIADQQRKRMNGKNRADKS
ncbi:SDR family oxidoreductase [Dongia soli]|uniref:SDR family oxidoreductase n=1 Tax=Dongia soli TaxID=600628 RepID=A0ABU5E671_9PROT|nr:SDR family oxidoreductase [Dongia soli]MDY0881787.1 SDR family oxidoreductase [Dongia soli]